MKNNETLWEKEIKALKCCIAQDCKSCPYLINCEHDDPQMLKDVLNIIEGNNKEEQC